MAICKNKYISILGLLILLIFSNVGYVLSFYLIFSLNTSTLIYSLLHSIMSIILSAFVLSTFQKSYSDGKLSIVSITFLITSIYYMFSEIKYTQPLLYAGFIQNNNLRLFGSFLVFISILLSNLLWIKINNKRKVNRSVIQINQIKVNKKIVLISLVIYISFVLWKYIQNPISHYVAVQKIPTSTDLLTEIIISTFTNILIFVSVLMCQKKNIITYFPIILVIGIFLFNSITSGSRSAIIGPLFLIIYILLFQQKVSLKKIFTLITFAPFAYTMFSALVFITSGRVSHLTKERLAWDIAYRFDFSDFPMTVLERTNYFFLNIGEIIDGIMFSIPSFLWRNKLVTMSQNTQQELLINSNLSPITDYTDSFFSMGAEIGGILGMIFLFPIILIIFEKVDAYFINKGIKGFLILIIIFNVITRIEIDWLLFIPSFRDKIFSIAFGLLIFKIFYKINKNRNRKANSIL